ncbi:uncharacterized protein LOC142644319 [Castanea sativa]|uniref:uncharacterized protein LOC142644319 n=1 Tax=Castanea sativa TaxID=21020 RepID=UPI003F64BFB3
MNTDMVRPFEFSEIYKALHQMDSNTSSGPDGLPPLFYKQFWNKVGGEVSEAVLSVLNSGNIPDKLNHTFLTLIPKIHSPWKVSDFRPISLSNVLYKIIAKVLANHLKPLLPHLISETQGVFLSERIITDNILIAHENLHYLKQKRTRKLVYMVLKLDMSKSYDRVEATIAECVQIQSMLFMYEQASGQSINRGKTNIFFNSKTPRNLRNAISVFLGVPVSHSYEHYLGLPSLVGRGKKRAFSLIKERIWKKLKGSKEKLLNQAGREILIKVVIQAIPTYVMSCFKLPKGLIKEIEILVRKFWWGYRGEQRKIHWVCWEKMCRPKNEGGLGFRDLFIFNDSLLSKQVWRLQTCENSLFYKVFKAKFIPSCSIMDCASLNKGSYAWKSILQSRHVVDVGAVWRIGDGQSVQICKDKWFPSLPATRSISPPSLLPPTSTVSDLIDSGSKSWKADLIRHEFLPHEANMILGIPLSDRSIPDKLVWLSSTNGSYTTCSAYKLVVGVTRSLQPSSSSQTNNHVLWTGIWKLLVPHRVKLFPWLASLNALPTICNLLRRKVVSFPTCSRCKCASEDTIHTLWYCTSLLGIWKDGTMLMKLLRYKFCGFDGLMGMVFTMRDQINIELLALMFWLIWCDRNASRLKEQRVGLHRIRNKAKDLLSDFLDANICQT